MRTCPSCAEKIQDAAIKCRHCGEAVVPVRPAGPSTLRILAALALACTIGLGGLIAFGWYHMPEQRAERGIVAWYATQGRVVTSIRVERTSPRAMVARVAMTNRTLLGDVPEVRVCDVEQGQYDSSLKWACQ